jgi:hypothetical protein
MTHTHPAWLARQQRRWLRLDNARFQKPRYIERKYSPDQPRVPAGNSRGGQWTGGGSSTGSLLIDTPASADAIFEEQSLADGAVQLAYLGQVFQAGRLVVQTGIEAALGLYAALSAGNGPDRSAVAVFRAMDFEPGADPLSPVGAVGSLTREEVDQICPAQGLVQDLTNEAAASFNRADYSASGYGTAVHMKLKNDIGALHDPNLLAEVSYLKTLMETGAKPMEPAYYGQQGSIRVDVLEKTSSYTVCVYDIKTGRSVLLPSRMREIAQTVSNNFPGTLRIVVTETRPRR